MVIGLSGRANAGKDFIANKYFRPQGFYQVSLAWHFKIWLASKGEATYEEVFFSKPPKVRSLLQIEGTEKGRDVYGKDIWCETTYNWIRLYEELWGFSKFVIADVRFPSEVEFIQRKGGKVFRLLAPNRIKDSKLSEEARQHPSETSLDGYTKFDDYIFNDYDNSAELDLQMTRILESL